jgi:hypothetical protein
LLFQLAKVFTLKNIDYFHKNCNKCNLKICLHIKFDPPYIHPLINNKLLPLFPLIYPFPTVPCVLFQPVGVVKQQFTPHKVVPPRRRVWLVRVYIFISSFIARAVREEWSSLVTLLPPPKEGPARITRQTSPKKMSEMRKKVRVHTLTYRESLSRDLTNLAEERL